MKTKAALFLVSFILSHQLIAQTLSPNVISSSGGFSANGSAMLSSTVGEMAMVETFNTAGVILTQGFQQPEDFGVSVKDLDPVSSEITLGPNPSHGCVQVFFTRALALNLDIRIFDIAGKLIYRNAVVKHADNTVVSFNLSSLACGEYVFDCKSTRQDNGKQFSFSKKLAVIN